MLSSKTIFRKCICRIGRIVEAKNKTKPKTPSCQHVLERLENQHSNLGQDDCLVASLAVSLHIAPHSIVKVCFELDAIFS